MSDRPITRIFTFDDDKVSGSAGARGSLTSRLFNTHTKLRDDLECNCEIVHSFTDLK